MPKPEHKKKTTKRKPIKQTAKIATLNDMAQGIIDLYSDYIMTDEYNDIPLTNDLIHAKNEFDQLVSRIQSGAADMDEVGFFLDDYFMQIENAAEERGFVLGYLYAVTRANNVIHDEEKGEMET